MSGASERANGRASGPVLTSRFLFIPDHSVLIPQIMWVCRVAAVPAAIAAAVEVAEVAAVVWFMKWQWGKRKENE